MSLSFAYPSGWFWDNLIYFPIFTTPLWPFWWRIAIMTTPRKKPNCLCWISAILSTWASSAKRPFIRTTWCGLKPIMSCVWDQSALPSWSGRTHWCSIGKILKFEKIIWKKKEKRKIEIWIFFNFSIRPIFNLSHFQFVPFSICPILNFYWFLASCFDWNDLWICHDSKSRKNF